MFKIRKQDADVTLQFILEMNACNVSVETLRGRPMNVRESKNAYT